MEGIVSRQVGCVMAIKIVLTGVTKSRPTVIVELGVSWKSRKDPARSE